MKIIHKLTAAMVALGIAAQANADNVVYLTGSTAFRATVYNALHTAGTIFDGGGTNIVTEAEFGSSQSGANYMLFHGNINGTPTYIDCAWSGSEAGIASACGVAVQNTDRDGNPIPLAGSPETWVKADGSIPMTGLQGSAPSSGQLEASSHIADLAQADTSQTVSQTPRVINTATDLKDYGVEGIVTFVWCKNVNTSPSQAWLDLTNITIPEANVLFASGFQPASFFTGKASETNNLVYLIGRNKGSGTRANELSDTGYGTYTPVQQFSVGFGIEEPADGSLTLTYEGNNGYESGGGVATAMGINGSCGQNDPFYGPGTAHNDTWLTGWFAVAFLGPSDAVAHGLSTADWLSCDGVAESDGTIEEGQYAMWGHEHLYGRNGISGYQDTVAQKIFSGVQSSISSNGSVTTAQDPSISLTYMHCDKASDVAYPASNFSP